MAKFNTNMNRSAKKKARKAQKKLMNQSAPDAKASSTFSIRQKQIKETKDTKAADKPWGFAKLPTEIIQKIVNFAITHSRSLPVDPLFNTRSKFFPPPMDYRLLHTSRNLYLMGLKPYYERNVFNISIGEWITKSDALQPAVWPEMTGLLGMSLFVRDIEISARYIRNWNDSIRLLRGFQALNKVTFDVRRDPNIDSGREGMREDPSWQVVPAHEDIYLALARGGVTIGEGGIWIGWSPDDDTWGPNTEEKAIATNNLLVNEINEEIVKRGY